MKNNSFTEAINYLLRAYLLNWYWVNKGFILSENRSTTYLWSCNASLPKFCLKINVIACSLHAKAKNSTHLLAKSLSLSCSHGVDRPWGYIVLTVLIAEKPRPSDSLRLTLTFGPSFTDENERSPICTSRRSAEYITDRKSLWRRSKSFHCFFRLLYCSGGTHFLQRKGGESYCNFASHKILRMHLAHIT